MSDSRRVGGTPWRFVAVVLAGALGACAAPERVSLLRPVLPAREAAADLVLDVAFDAGHCPSRVTVAEGVKCEPTGVNCGRAFRQRLVTFRGAEAFSVFFDPSQPPFQAVQSGGPAFEKSITVNPTAERGVEYKYSVISPACSGRYFDPIIIVEN